MNQRDDCCEHSHDGWPREVPRILLAGPRVAHHAHQDGEHGDDGDRCHHMILDEAKGRRDGNERDGEVQVHTTRDRSAQH